MSAWSRERPTKAGWYWYRRIDVPAHCIRAAVLEVRFQRGKLKVYDDYGDGVLWHPLREYMGEWQGPITPNEAME